MERTTKLLARAVEKPWGQLGLPAGFASEPGRRTGEIWFEHPEQRALPLLAKYLFTGERLSVQVHPSDAEARLSGAPFGKTECWYVMSAEPDATIAVGFRGPVPAEDVRQAALDGSIEHMLAWRQVRTGDFIFVPAGTVHAIGAGLSILELQQASDLTYRLFDYGRERRLHLDDALKVASLTPAVASHFGHAEPQEDRILISAPQFSLVHASSEAGARSMRERQRWMLPVLGSLESDGQCASVGECLLVPPDVDVRLTEASVVLIGAVGEFAG